MKKFETRLRIIMTLEKLEGRRNLMGKAWQPIDRVEVDIYVYESFAHLSTIFAYTSWYPALVCESFCASVVVIS